MDATETLNRVSKPLGHAVLKLFNNDQQAASQWLMRPCKALGSISPIEYIALNEGEQEVFGVISRLEHGVFQ